MARRSLAAVTLRAQLVAVRRAASTAALDCRPDDRPNISLQSKHEQKRDALTAAALTLEQVEASRQALDILPDAQRDRLAVALAAAGFRAVRIDAATDMTVAVHV
jgi:hypothetical protein